MSTADEVQIMLVQKLGDNILPERERYAPIIFAPTVDFLVGVGPKEIAQESGIRHIGGSHNALDLIQAGKLGAESSVHAKDFLVNDCRGGEAVEAVGKGLPKLDTETSLALVVESVDTVNGCAFVITPEDEKVLGVLNLVGEQQANCFETLLSSINVVSTENVV